MIESDCFVQVNDDLSGWIANRAPNAALRKMALGVVKHSTPEQWVDYFQWNVVEIDIDTCLDISQTLRNIDADFPILSIGVAKMQPNTYYPLHKDTLRGCGINLMLSDCNLHSTESFCAWGSSDSNETYQLRYEQDTMYLLNTRIHHTVYNFGSERLMLIVELETTNIDQREYFPDYAQIKELLEQL